MPKAILMMLLVVASASAMAGWVKVSSNETVTLYAHPDTIRKITFSNNIIMWSLHDYNTAQELTSSRPYLSVKFQYEYNCEEEQIRKLYSIPHSENMGGGISLYRRKPDMIWTPISPGSIIKILWKFACGNNERMGNKT